MSFFCEEMDSKSGELDLKMTILRLEEELALYRNGMSGTELLAIIAEKDRDIAALQASLAEGNEKLRKIAKGSSEVLAKLNIITSEKVELEERVQSLSEANASQIVALSEKDESITKLQARCAQLVQEKTKEKSETNKKLKEFKDELEKAIRFNVEIKNSVHELSCSNSQLTQQICILRRELEESNADRALLKEKVDQQISASLDTDELRQKLDKEISKAMAYKSQAEALSQKLKVYEDKIKRQEQYLKSKILKDRTNSVSATGISGATQCL